MFERNVAEGIHRIEDAHTHFYLVEDDGQVTVVDTGLPRSWGSLVIALRELGRSVRDVAAVVLTHAHYDRMGFARRAQHELDAPVWAYTHEAALAAHPWRFDHERPIAPYLRHPQFLKVFTEMGLMRSPVGEGHGRAAYLRRRRDARRPRAAVGPPHARTYARSLRASFPGSRPRPRRRRVRHARSDHGPLGSVHRCWSRHRRQPRALGSLDALAELDATVALTGHGPAFSGSLHGAVSRARDAGPA